MKKYFQKILDFYKQKMYIISMNMITLINGWHGCGCGGWKNPRGTSLETA